MPPVISTYATSRVTAADSCCTQHRRHCYHSGRFLTRTVNSRSVGLGPTPHIPTLVSCDRPLERVGLGRDSVCGLRHDRIGFGPGNRDQYSWGKRGNEPNAGAQCNQRVLELSAHRVRGPRLLECPAGSTASRIPSSQSSFPFFIFSVFTELNPTSFNEALVSASE